MMQINLIYWSGTGNTEAMANLIKEGAESAGATVNLKNVSDASIDDVNCDVLVLGCPSMGDEVLEESEFEPFMISIEGSLSGKKLALFGSYGWGDGQWMRDWDERMKNAGAVLAVESLIVNDAPSGESEQECKDFGREIAQ
ncbi:flavodoxin [Faecalicatena contorta]